MRTGVTMKTIAATFIRGAIATAVACLLLWLVGCGDTDLRAGPRRSVSPNATNANPMGLRTP